MLSDLTAPGSLLKGAQMSWYSLPIVQKSLPFRDARPSGRPRSRLIVLRQQQESFQDRQFDEFRSRYDTLFDW